ncbi:glycosyltransferase [Mycobacterium sp. Y57]|uniref:glycosyltransferase n=1 Tax=Mycolicibacterium xanthum TaxID=2796469 RepID=UPI001C85520D|nr:glycosyltransferase [Mycolicibacterium xanthum]MBX7431921.1 glycosyltransferase [Mycolicibacterium xanthum]
MRFAVAAHGTRGDIEPCTAVGLELRRRGHEVRLAVPPNLVGFAQQAIGPVPVVSYGVDSQKQLEEATFRNFWKFQNPARALREGREYMVAGWAEMSRSLTSIADGADLILTGTTFQEVSANVAEHYGVPLAALHFFPHRANSHVLPLKVPPSLYGPGFAAVEWAYWRILKDAEDAQRRELGLPKADTPSVRRIIEGGALEIQAYDEALFPGLASQWGERRPFVGALTLELGTVDDDEMTEWIAEGKPPIYFGFGSMPVESPESALDMITEVCADLGERALISSGSWQLDRPTPSADIKVVGAVNHARVFPQCRAVVHHGGAGTLAAGLRAGRPTLVLWVGADQPIWAAQVKRLGVGTARRFSKTGPTSLKAALQATLSPQAAVRAEALATQMTAPSEGVRKAADLLEDAARRRGVR